MSSTPRPASASEAAAAPLRAIVVMGVSGCGKSSVGQGLAHALGWRYLEGDSLHSQANVQKMASGTPLTDADRADWLAALAARLAQACVDAGANAGVDAGVDTGVDANAQPEAHAQPDATAQPDAGGGLVLACSALKRSYRDRLRRDLPPGAALGLLHLHGTPELLAERLRARQDHYMPASLLPSQLSTLELPGPDEALLTLDIALPLAQQIEAARQHFAPLTVPQTTPQTASRSRSATTFEESPPR